MEFQDRDLKTALLRAFRIVLILAAVGSISLWIVLGWRSAALFLVGAAIASSSILVWEKLMGAVLARLNAGGTPRPLSPVLVWFFVHLLLSGCLLYVSLRGLHGSVYALAAGLGLALIGLMIESFRLLKVWTL
jgi:hypothetical protein